jgi:hypothetical protein
LPGLRPQTCRGRTGSRSLSRCPAAIPSRLISASMVTCGIREGPPARAFGRASLANSEKNHS